MNPVGSIWGKWDLHIHTPASFHWDGKKLHEYASNERDALCKDIIDRINAVDVCAVCIMDYWTFEGYRLLREYLGRNPGATTKTIFPGIELRMQSPTDYRLNTHVLLSDTVPLETLGHFLSRLKLGGVNGKPPSRPTFVEIAKSYDAGTLRRHGYDVSDKADEDKMHLLGMMTAEVTQESLLEATAIVVRDNCLLVQPFDTSDGLKDLDWEEHPYTATSIMKDADCFETRKPKHVDLFLGFGIPEKPHVGPEFIESLGGYPKPVFSGSDAHKLATYGVYPSNRITWLKAQPTFKGLRQVCNEPALRCFIGVKPPKLVHVEENPTKYIHSISLAKSEDSEFDEHWFHGREIELNPGLIAIIGNKGSGKSALADILAIAGNSHCSNMEFLTEDRFGNKAKHFVATLTWADGTKEIVNLADRADHQKPERVRYLPQHFIENLCNEIATGNDTSFSKELKKVIFLHVPTEKQLQMSTLDELLNYLIKARKQAFAQLQQSLHTINEEIVRHEQEISEDTLKSYKNSLALKEAELRVLEETPIAVVEKPAEDPNDANTQEAIRQIAAKKQGLDAIREMLDAMRKERQELISEQATLSRLIGHVDNFESSYKTFVVQHQEEFQDADFSIQDIVKLTVDRTPLNDANTRITTRLSEIQSEVDGKPATDTDKGNEGLESLAKKTEVEITRLQDGLDAPQKSYQEYLKVLETRNQRKAGIVGTPEQIETIEYFKARIKRAEEFIPGVLMRLREERRDLVRKLHAEVLAIRQAHEELYAPVQKIAADATNSAHAIQLEFDASVANNGFESNFLDFIHRGRKGTFYGEDESRAAVRALLRSHDFNSADSVVAFTDAVMNALTHVKNEDGKVEGYTIASQLRDKKKVIDLYDFIFGLNYLEIRYNLRLGGKEISQLSPGEKGALLLVFYLLLDTEEIPIIIDQPEHNLDNESVVRLLVDCIRKARARRQVMIVTHNPNLAVFCDADQVIYCTIDKANGNKIGYSTGAIEDGDINTFAVNVLEGSYPAFDNRRRKWHKPQG